MEDLEHSLSNTIRDENQNEEEIKQQENKDEQREEHEDTENSLNEDIDDNETIDTQRLSTDLTKIPSKTDLNVQFDVSHDNLKIESDQSLIRSNNQRKENLEQKSLNEYLNKHQRFLNSIDHQKQLSVDQRRQLDREKQDLKKLQMKLVKQIEDNNRKHLYEKQKQNEMSKRRDAYLQRRSQETKLKESRKVRIQTTFRLSEDDKRSTSLSPVRSSISTHHPNHVGCQTDFDKHIQQHSDQLGQSLKELITHFVEHSKQSWIHQ